MIILSFFLENFEGSVKKLRIRSYSTGFLFSTEDYTKIATKDLIIEALPERTLD